MSRIIVEYNPNLSVSTRRLIATRITPSMVSHDESSSQFEISLVAQLLDEYENEEVKLVNQLIEEGVHYLEF